MNIEFMPNPTPTYAKCKVPIQIGDIVKTSHGCEGFITEINQLTNSSIVNSLEQNKIKDNVSISFNWQITKQGRGRNASPVGTITCGYLHSKINYNYYKNCVWLNPEYWNENTELNRNNLPYKSAFSNIDFFVDSSTYTQIGRNLFNLLNCSIAPDDEPTNYYVEKMKKENLIHSELEKEEKKVQEEKKKDFLDAMEKDLIYSKLERLYNSVGELDKLIKECQNLKNKLNEILEE